MLSKASKLPWLQRPLEFVVKQMIRLSLRRRRLFGSWCFSFHDGLSSLIFTGHLLFLQCLLGHIRIVWLGHSVRSLKIVPSLKCSLKNDAFWVNTNVMLTCLWWQRLTFWENEQAVNIFYIRHSCNQSRVKCVGKVCVGLTLARWLCVLHVAELPHLNLLRPAISIQGPQHRQSYTCAIFKCYPPQLYTERFLSSKRSNRGAEAGRDRCPATYTLTGLIQELDSWCFCLARPTPASPCSIPVMWSIPWLRASVVGWEFGARAKCLMMSLI